MHQLEQLELQEQQPRCTPVDRSGSGVSIATLAGTSSASLLGQHVTRPRPPTPDRADRRLMAEEEHPFGFGQSGASTTRPMSDRSITKLDEWDRNRCHHHLGAAVSAFLKALIVTVICRYSANNLFSLGGLWGVNAIAVAVLLTSDRREMWFLIPFLLIGTFFSNAGTRNIADSFLAKVDFAFIWVQVLDVAATYFIIAWGAPQYRALATTRAAFCIVAGSFVGPVLFASFGTLLIQREYHMDPSFYSRTFIRIFCSDSLAMIMFVPFVISLEPKILLRFVRRGPGPCILVLLCILLIIAIELVVPFAYATQSLFNQEQLRFLAHSLSLPIVLFAGFLVGSLGFTISSLAMGVTAISSVLFFDEHGRLDKSAPELLSDLLRLQIIMIVVELASLTFMVIQAQRDMALEDSNSAGKHKTAFMAFLCHELRNPLHAILNISSFLAESELDAEQSQLCEAIQVSSSYMSELLNDVLDSAKLEAGKLELKPAFVNAEEVLLSVINPFREDVKNRSLTFWTEVNELNFILELDTMRVKQVINNLLSNAIKFTPQNGEIAFKATLEVDLVNPSTVTATSLPDTTTVAIDEADFPVPSSTPALALRSSPSTLPSTNPDVLNALHPALVIEISDSGVGIKPDTLEKLFRPYEQRSSANREYGGTGLGLSICKQLVDLMRGDITVETEEGIGTTFTVRIPTRSGVPTLGGAVDEDVAEEYSPGRGGSITRKGGGMVRSASARIGYEMDVLAVGRGVSSRTPRRGSDVTLSSEGSAAGGAAAGGVDAVVVDLVVSVEDGVAPGRRNQRSGGVDNAGRGEVRAATGVTMEPLAPYLVATSSGTQSSPQLPPSPLWKLRKPVPSVVEPTPPQNPADELPRESMPTRTDEESLMPTAPGLSHCSPPTKQAMLETGPAAPDHAETSEAPAKREWHVLIVDDSLINRRILRKLMETLQVERVDECCDGQQAVDLVSSLDDPSAYDVIFMDIQMPVLLGTEATRLLRGLGCTSPIIAVTANSITSEGFVAEWGFTALAPKPFLRKDAEMIFKEYVLKRVDN
ncbi:hypothetical protein HK101_010961 [Irineochytrium annulatum]|nr:hypothetical protein HK101_010961 [Irineochytrium annulatum]